MGQWEEYELQINILLASGHPRSQKVFAFTDLHAEMSSLLAWISQDVYVMTFSPYPEVCETARQRMLLGGELLSNAAGQAILLYEETDPTSDAAFQWEVAVANSLDRGAIDLEIATDLADQCR